MAELKSYNTNLAANIKSINGNAFANIKSLNGLTMPSSYNWDLANAAYDTKYFSCSAQDGEISDVYFKPDGTKMYVNGKANKKIYQYSLSTAWDISTASYDSIFFLLTSQTSKNHSITFKPDGTKMYISDQDGGGNPYIYQYSLSTAWDLATASYDSISYKPVISGVTFVSPDTSFKLDGTKMYINNGLGGGGSRTYQFSLSTAWDISTASYDTKLASTSNYSTKLNFQPDGKKAFNLYTYSTSGSINQFSLSTAWDISTVSYVKGFSVYSQVGSWPKNSFFKQDGGKFYCVGGSNNNIYQYSY